mgnify:CR=1 FL=1
MMVRYVQILNKFLHHYDARFDTVFGAKLLAWRMLVCLSSSIAYVVFDRKFLQVWYLMLFGLATFIVIKRIPTLSISLVQEKKISISDWVVLILGEVVFIYSSLVLLKG